ncbi:hypothetical protein V8E36_007687 [Tilletia maclaganii]
MPYVRRNDIDLFTTVQKLTESNGDMRALLANIRRVRIMRDALIVGFAPAPRPKKGHVFTPLAQEQIRSRILLMSDGRGPVCMTDLEKWFMWGCGTCGKATFGSKKTLEKHHKSDHTSGPQPENSNEDAWDEEALAPVPTGDSVQQSAQTQASIMKAEVAMSAKVGAKEEHGVPGSTPHSRTPGVGYSRNFSLRTPCSAQSLDSPLELRTPFVEHKV